jgi:hypothetical protein
MSYTFDDRQKPPALAGVNCPLYKQDVSDVCHKCDWYRPSQEGQLDPRTRHAVGIHTKWRCALVQQLKTFHDYGAIMDGIQAATESSRNEIAGRLDVIAEDAMVVAETAKQAMASGGISIGQMTQAARHRIGGAVKQLEDKSKP